MIPDKIYIEQKAVMYDLVNTEPCKPDDYVYIRKDALLEWARDNRDNAGKLSYTEFIDKIESL